MKDLAILAIELSLSNQELLDMMHKAKELREDGKFSNIICAVHGFDDDSRELYEIPEVRAFCRRLVCQGFISYLDFCTTVPEACDGETLDGWGAMEVWLCSEGRLAKTVEITEPLLKEIEAVLLKSNAKADAAVGPMKL